MHKQSIKKLNLGCGYDKKKNWINLDYVADEGVDVVWDLNKFPYPFKNSEFDIVLANQVLEHVENPGGMIKEIWRITKNNAIIKINTPHFSCWQVWGDLTHRRAFNHTSLFPFCERQQKKKAHNSLLEKRDEKFKIESRITFGKIKTWFKVSNNFK